jgi:small subunit ribosomal protein S1
VSKVDAFVQQGSEVEVKVLSFDRDSQKIALSIKAAQQNAAAVEAPAQQEEIEEPPREVAVKALHDGPLRGGNNRDTGGAQFGLRW